LGVIDLMMLLWNEKEMTKTEVKLGPHVIVIIPSRDALELVIERQILIKTGNDMVVSATKSLLEVYIHTCSYLLVQIEQNSERFAKSQDQDIHISASPPDVPI